jgi:hypothetical protein
VALSQAALAVFWLAAIGLTFALLGWRDHQVLTRGADRGDAIRVEAPEPLGHPQNRSVLGLQFLVVALGSLGNQYGLNEVRRIVHRELRVSRTSGET